MRREKSFEWNISLSIFSRERALQGFLSHKWCKSWRHCLPGPDCNKTKTFSLPNSIWKSSRTLVTSFFDLCKHRAYLWEKRKNVLKALTCAQNFQGEYSDMMLRKFWSVWRIVETLKWFWKDCATIGSGDESLFSHAAIDLN